MPVSADPLTKPSSLHGVEVASPADLVRRGKVVRALWLGAGLILLGIGIVGMVTPLLPTIDFLLLALPCFARSSPRLEHWLLNHPRFGPALRAWTAHRAVPRHAKAAACIGMATGYGLFYFFLHPKLLLASVVLMVLLLCALWIVRRPAPETMI